MRDEVKISFEKQIVILSLNDILPSKMLPPAVKESAKYRRIAASVAQLGLVEPLVVSRPKSGGPYLLLDGHVRFSAMRDQGSSQARCLIASDDESFTYNKRVNRLATIQEHYMIVRALERGVIPHTIAMEIAKAKEGEVQQALAKAYEEKAIPGNQVLAIRQIIEQRNASGKGLHHRSSPHRTKGRVTSEALIRAYQRETERQQQLVKRASLTQSRLMFVTNALKRLLADDHFVALMRAEGVGSVPSALAERIGYDRG